MVSPKKSCAPDIRLINFCRTVALRSETDSRAVTIAEPVELLCLSGVKPVVKRDRLRILRLPPITRPALRNRAAEPALE